MKIAFFVSSLGDTDLAIDTIHTLLDLNQGHSLFLIPLTTAAATRTLNPIGDNAVCRITLDNLIHQPAALTQNQISAEGLQAIADFVHQNKIDRAYVGVTSSIDHEIPFQIAEYLKIPCTIAYEFMFKPAKHIFWQYVDRLAAKENCQFAVPLSPATHDLLSINNKAKVFAIGHRCIDSLQNAAIQNTAQTRESLGVKTEDELIFVSGTTQPTEVDNQFLDALLAELSTGKYPQIQIRMGLHPGVKDNDADTYLQTLLETCEKYSKTISQFKIILTTPFEKKLKKPFHPTPVILRCEISGSDAAQSSEKIAQAVPGALLNESALKGKPSYFHDNSAIPYLPKLWFSASLSEFFTAKPSAPHTPVELGLKEPAKVALSKLIQQ